MLDMLTVARNTMPVPEVIKLLDYIIFNVAICNTDAHAKNYSLIITANRPRLAPLYDVNCTQVWSGITSNMFQSIAKKNRGAHLKRRHWEELAKEAGFNAPSMIKRIRGLLNRIDEQIGNARQAVTAMPAGDHAILDQVEKTIRERIKRLQNGLAESAIPQVGVAAAEMSSANDREKLDMREEYVSALREARTAGGFRKLVKMLENDRKMKAIDVKSIAHELLDRKFPSKKAAIAALATSGAPVSRLVS